MKTSYQILQALLETLRRTRLAERVESMTSPDLEVGLEVLCAAPDEVMLVIPLGDTWVHEVDVEGNMPLRSESRERFVVLCSNRELAMGEGRPGTVLPMKDHVTSVLLWDKLGQPGLLCLPLGSEPVDLGGGEDGNMRGRVAWKVELEVRQLLVG